MSSPAMLFTVLKRHLRAWKTHTQAHALQPATFSSTFQGHHYFDIAFAKSSATCRLVPPLILTFVLKRRPGGWAVTRRRGSETLSNRISLRRAVGSSRIDLIFSLHLVSFSISRFFFFFPVTSSPKWKKKKTECPRVDASGGGAGSDPRPARREKCGKRCGAEVCPPSESRPGARRDGPRPPRIRAPGPPRPGAACRAAASRRPQAGPQTRPEAAGGESRPGAGARGDAGRRSPAGTGCRRPARPPPAPPTPTPWAPAAGKEGERASGRGAGRPTGTRLGWVSLAAAAAEPAALLGQ